MGSLEVDRNLERDRDGTQTWTEEIYRLLRNGDIRWGPREAPGLCVWDSQERRTQPPLAQYSWERQTGVPRHGSHQAVLPTRHSIQIQHPVPDRQTRSGSP